MKGFLSRVGGGSKESSNGGGAASGGGKASSEGAVSKGADGATPKADLAMPKGKEKRRPSYFKSPKNQLIKELPLLSETPMLKRETLFRQKLKMCCVLFDFDESDPDTKGIEIKRETLVELAEYVNTPVGQKIFTEAMMPDIVEMVRTNLFRALPPQTDDFDPEEDEPTMEPAWPHLQVVYEFFLRFIVSTEVNGKVAKKYVDLAFIRSWIELFDAEDPRERDYVKTVLHRMYGKFMSYRSHIRKAISQVFFRYIYETGRHNGIGELLEILGSIVNGFAIPLKREHLQFLERALLPLHKPSGVAMYHPQLLYCISQFVEKDPDTIVPIVTGLSRYWPWCCPSKQVLFLNELEEVLEVCRGEQLTKVQDNLFRLLADCLSSAHFQVAERTLYYWNSEHLCVNMLLQQKAGIFLPYVFGPLSKHAAGHWNPTVEGLAQSVLKMYMEMDISLYDKCSRENNEKLRLMDAEREAANNKWQALINMAHSKGTNVDALL